MRAPIVLTLLVLLTGCSSNPPELAEIEAQVTAVGVPVRVDVAAQAPDSSIPQLTLASSLRGAALTDNGDGTGTFTWMPDSAQSGTHSVVIEAQVDGAAHSQTFSIDVLASRTEWINKYWKVAFEDPDAGRIAVANPGDGSSSYVTPDSLIAEGPVTDSSWEVIYFLAYPRSQEGTVNAIYAVDVDGTNLRRLAELPLRALDLQVTPSARTYVFTGRYPDQEFIRGYQMNTWDSSFRATTPADRHAYDPAMAPGGLNYVFHDSTLADTLWVSSLQETLNLPIYRDFVYTQVSISPDALHFAAVCGDERRGLCFMFLPERDGRVLIEEQDGVSITHPLFHPGGATVAYVHHEGGRTQLRTIDVNSLAIKEIPIDLPHPTHPVWVR